MVKPKTSAYPAGDPWLSLPNVHRSIENIFLRRNRQCNRDQLQWRSDDRLEWVCEHGTGHTVFCIQDEDGYEHWTHGCCGGVKGCCSHLVKFSIKFSVPDYVKEESK